MSSRPGCSIRTAIFSRTTRATCLDSCRENTIGDYLMLDIDIDTGRVLNWQKPSATAIEQFIAGKS